MPLQDIVILVLIVSVFVTFGMLLGWVTWDNSDKRKRARHLVDRRPGHYPTHPNLMTDDD